VNCSVTIGAPFWPKSARVPTARDHRPSSPAPGLPFPVRIELREVVVRAARRDCVRAETSRRGLAADHDRVGRDPSRISALAGVLPPNGFSSSAKCSRAADQRMLDNGLSSRAS